MNLPAIPTDLATWTRIILPIVGAIVAVVLGWVLSRLAQRAVTQWMPRAGGSMVTVAPLAGQAARYGILIFALITALGFIGVPQASILTVVGTASLALALSLQNTLSNVAAGIMLAWIRPIAVGEYITGDGVEGVVIEIGLFGTRLRSTSGLYVFTNNNKLWNGAITNHSREPRRRIDLTVTVPDSTNVNRAREALLRIAKADKRVLPDPAAYVFVNSFGTDTLSLQMRLWVPTPQYRSAQRDLTEKVKFGINRLLAEKEGGGTAVVDEGEDPHVAHTGARTPDLS